MERNGISFSYLPKLFPSALETFRKENDLNNKPEEEFILNERKKFKIT